MPAQVKVVQLLSDIIRPPFEPCLRKIALLISAWDLVPDSGVTPNDWLNLADSPNNPQDFFAGPTRYVSKVDSDFFIEASGFLVPEFHDDLTAMSRSLDVEDIGIVFIDGRLRWA